MKVSVVIASGAGGDFLYHCLDSLKEQAQVANVEVIVVDRCGAYTRCRLRTEYPFVTVIPTRMEPRPSVPELRMIGVEQARGDIVAIIEEHCIASPDWIETIHNSFQESDAAIGGPILDNQYTSPKDWVVYFSEYHNYLPPWSAGERYLLNGENIAYNRQKLLKYQLSLSTGFWEVVVHPLLVLDGKFRAVPKMIVRRTGPSNYLYYLKQRCLLSRAWGGTQREKVRPIKRLAYLVLAPVIPLLLLFRITHRVWQKRLLTSRYITALPFLVPVVCVYVLGEWLGYLLGVGTALQWVE